MVDAQLISAEILVVGLGLVLVALAVFIFLPLEFWITAAKLVIGDITLYAILFYTLHVLFVGVAGVGSDHGAIFVEVFADAEFFDAFFDGIQNRLKYAIF